MLSMKVKGKNKRENLSYRLSLGICQCRTQSIPQAPRGPSKCQANSRSNPLASSRRSFCPPGTWRTPFARCSQHTILGCSLRISCSRECFGKCLQDTARKQRKHWRSKTSLCCKPRIHLGLSECENQANIKNTRLDKMWPSVNKE